MAKAGLFELNAVVAVATRRSFRRAAGELGMSPSALSHAVAALEQRLGVRLFNRTTRSVSLSEAGEQFLSRVRPALREITDAMAAANAARDTPSGTLRLNMSEGSARRIFPAVLEFLGRYPDMQVQLTTDDRFVDIVAKGFDAGVRLKDSVPQDMIAVPCSPDLRFAVVGAPRYFKTHPRPLNPGDLKAHACIKMRLPSGANYQWEFEKRGEEVSIEVEGALTLDSHELKLDAALRGAGLTYINEWAVEAHIAAGRLIRVLEDWTPPYPGLCLYYPGNRLVPAGLKAFVEVLRETTRSAAAAPPLRRRSS